MEKAAIYVRVSTDADAQKDSPAHQIATCKEYAQGIGLETADDLIYNDAGFSGTEISNRPEVQRMLADARTGQLDAILFTAISRFSRDLSDAFSMKKRLESVYGIRLISIEEGYDSAIEGRNSEMVFTIHAMLAAHKSQEMSKAIKRGLRQSARRGRHIGNTPPFGYLKTSDKKLMPDPESAPIIRSIFNMYLSGMGAKVIAETLNARGVPTASTLRSNRVTLWQASTVNVILHNEVYVGTIVAHKRTRRQDIAHSRRQNADVKRLRMRDEKEWVVIPSAHEPVVDPDTFDRVQRLLEAKSRNRGIRQTGNLLAGLMYCACCGGKMIVSTSSKQRSVKEYKYVVCSKVKRISKSACINHSITKYGDLLEAILNPRNADALSDTERKEICRALSMTEMPEGNYVQDRIAAICAKLDRNTDMQKRNLEAYRTGLFSQQMIEQSQRDLMAEADKLKSARLHLQRQNQEQQDPRPQRLDEDAEDANLFKTIHQFDRIAGQMILQQLLDAIVIDRDGRIAVFWAWCATTPRK